ncbi:MAG: CFI-box-CTERM domain-containing protein [Bdellovibrio sp.]
MKYWATSVFVAIFFINIYCHATATLVGAVTGVSNQDLSDPAAPKLYAGFTSCTTDNVNNTNTCDSCLGDSGNGTKLYTCNKHSAYPNLILTIRVAVAATGATSATPVITINSKTYTPVKTPTYADGIVTAQLTWSEICNHPEIGKNTTCDGDFSADLAVGLQSTSSASTTTDSLTFKVFAKVAIANGGDWFNTDCGSTAATTNTGACHFSAYPGDEKIYADQFAVAEGYPSTSTAGITFTNVVFFYEPAQSNGEADAAIVSRISNKSPSYTLAVNTAASPPIADNRITGLSNDVKYCMVMANQDTSGNIYYYTPVSSPAVPPASLCATPSQVVGLLDDKKCFIATAAFGSDMAPEVQSFRAFRNKFLLPFPWGRAFVKFYYKHSPFYANLIAQNETAKAIVRGALWPLLYFARMSVSLGFWMSLAVISMTLFFLTAINKMWIFRKKCRGEK